VNTDGLNVRDFFLFLISCLSRERQKEREREKRASSRPTFRFQTRYETQRIVRVASKAPHVHRRSSSRVHRRLPPADFCRESKRWIEIADVSKSRCFIRPLSSRQFRAPVPASAASSPPKVQRTVLDATSINNLSSLGAKPRSRSYRGMLQRVYLFYYNAN